MNGPLLLALFARFCLLSLLAIGGGLTIAPDAQRFLVKELGALSGPQFAASIAIGQASPGPNALFVAALGYQAAGLAGAAAAMAGMLLPSTMIALAAARWDGMHPGAFALAVFKAGMAPVTIALLLATAWLLTVGEPGWGHVAMTVAAAVLVLRTRVHILWIIAAGAVLGAAGLV